MQSPICLWTLSRAVVTGIGPVDAICAPHLDALSGRGDPAEAFSLAGLVGVGDGGSLIATASSDGHRQPA